MLNKLERKLGRYAIPNLIAFLVFGQLASFVLSMAKPEFASLLVLVPERVLAGEVWRVVSFLFYPPEAHIVFVAFVLYLLYLYGQALEAMWGAFRFNAYVFIGWIATVGAAFAVPGAEATNVYLMESIFLAFAMLNPDFELRLFFVLPVKVRWLGWFIWAYFGYIVAMGSWSQRALVIAAVVNFFLFFAGEIRDRIRGFSRRTRRVASTPPKSAAKKEATHRCTVCGLTDLEAPSMTFRYCSRCEGAHAYCADHLRDHEHVRAR